MGNLEAYGEKVVGLTGSVVEWTQTQTTGTKIAEINIDGTAQDVYAPSGGGGGSLNYSTTEQVVGTWIDGKPVYQRTFEMGAMPNNNTKTLAHGIANIGQIVHMFGTAFKSDYSDMIPLPCNTSGSNVCLCFANSTNIGLKTVTNLSSYNAVVTMQYLKTTD